MNREDIIRMAREACFKHQDEESIQYFADLVAAAEREACAKVCDEVGGRDTDSHAWDAAAAIRGKATERTHGIGGRGE